MYFYTLYKSTGESKYKKNAIDIIEKCVGLLSDTSPFPTYAAGVAGFASYISYLETVSFIDEIITPEIDEYLFAELEKYITANNYDFLHGAIGIATYFLYRYKYTHTPIICRALDLILKYIDTFKIEDHSGYKWVSKNLTKRKYEFNISLSHGMASILFFLSKFKESGYKHWGPINAEKLMTNTAKYIIAQKISSEIFNSYYPYLALESTTDLTGSRMAWCYGDLGISLSLYRAGAVLNNSEIIYEALSPLLYSAKNRFDLKSNGVFEAGLCHGAAGIAHIFNIMYRNTHETSFADASHYWMRQTIDLGNKDNGYCGYSVWLPMVNSWGRSLGLLEGISGIGLALASYLYPEKKIEWDQFLFMS